MYEAKNFFLVGLGGFFGSVFRYGMYRWIPHSSSSHFPWTTLLVNGLGCFSMGLVFGYAEKNNLFQTPYYLFLTVGVLGGFTTFSAFGLETVQMLRDGQLFLAALNTFSQVAIGLLAIFLGRLVIAA